VTGCVVYDAGMLIALANRSAVADGKHVEISREVVPVVPGPVLAQVWRDHPAIKTTLSRCLATCHVETKYTERDYKRIGLMLGDVQPPRKKRPDFVCALVAYTAAGRAPAAVLTSDPADIIAYLGTLARAPVLVVPV
jgi:hypothetical protein